MSYKPKPEPETEPGNEFLIGILFGFVCTILFTIGGVQLLLWLEEMLILLLIAI